MQITKITNDYNASTQITTESIGGSQERQVEQVEEGSYVVGIHETGCAVQASAAPWNSSLQ